MKKFLILLTLILSHSQAFATLYPPITACKTWFERSEPCIKDCYCGWCKSNSTGLCLNGDSNGPYDVGANGNHTCDEDDWLYTQECVDQRKTESKLINAAVYVVGIGIIIGTTTFLMKHPPSLKCCVESEPQ